MDRLVEIDTDPVELAPGLRNQHPVATRRRRSRVQPSAQQHHQPLGPFEAARIGRRIQLHDILAHEPKLQPVSRAGPRQSRLARRLPRSEEHTSELQSLMRISYAVFCLKQKRQTTK